VWQFEIERQQKHAARPDARRRRGSRLALEGQGKNRCQQCVSEEMKRESSYNEYIYGTTCT